MKITCYKSLFNPKAGDFQIPVEKAFSRIKNGSSKTLLEKIRTVENKDEKNKLKQLLPCYLFSRERFPREMTIQLLNIPD